MRRQALGHEERGLEHYTMVVCQVRECNRAVFLVINDSYGQFFDNPHAFDANVYPSAEAQYAPDGVPEKIAEEFCEAVGCSWNGHAFAAALVGRRVLQAAARDVLGGKRHDLKTEIDDTPTTV
jgi:hypothetical protein